MVKSVNKLLLTALSTSLLLSSCAGEFTAEHALSTIQGEEEFQDQFYAPIYLGGEILTDDNYDDPDGYIYSKYGELVDAGLITTSVGTENSWRRVVEITLTDSGEDLVAPGRTESLRQKTDSKNAYYVATCTLVPEKILAVKPLTGDTIEVEYTIVERALTPFGTYLEFSEGREHIHSRKFIKGTFNWELVPIM